jgi:DNA sulfur modification protein DndE
MTPTETNLETIRLGPEARIQLTTLKRRTGIENWNVLCRWAFCMSLADPTPIRELKERGGAGVEMTWKTFAGEEEELYRFLLIDRCTAEHGTTDREAMARTVRQHIDRGIARLVSQRSAKSITDFINLLVGEQSPIEP